MVPEIFWVSKKMEVRESGNKEEKKGEEKEKNEKEKNNGEKKVWHERKCENKEEFKFA